MSARQVLLAWWLGFASLGCAHVTASDVQRREGATLVVGTARGARQGELFAVSAERVWLCDDGGLVAVPMDQVLTALTSPGAFSLEVAHPEAWAQFARHPEGLPADGASCDAPRDEAVGVVMEVTTEDGEVVTGPLLAANGTTLVVDAEHLPRCFVHEQLADVRMRLVHSGRPQRASAKEASEPDHSRAAGVAGASAAGVAEGALLGGLAGAGAALVVLLPVALIAGVVIAATSPEESDSGPRPEMTALDRTRLVSLKSYARYPAGLPAGHACLSTPRLPPLSPPPLPEPEDPASPLEL